MNTATKRYQLIELQVPAAGIGAGGRLYFQDQPQLRTQINQLVHIKAIDTFTNDSVTLSPSGIAVAPLAALKNAFLVLNVSGTEELQYIPLVSLNRNAVVSGTVPFVVDQFMLENVFNIDWTKSYLQFGAAQTGPISFLFGVNYSYVPQRPVA